MTREDLAEAMRERQRARHIPGRIDAMSDGLLIRLYMMCAKCRKPFIHPEDVDLIIDGASCAKDFFSVLESKGTIHLREKHRHS